MKSCPACKRVEHDDTLAFCRADGTQLVSDSNSLGAEIGTVKFRSAPGASEVETSVLPHHATDADIHRVTGSTTVLDRRPTIGETGELSKPKRRRAWLLSLGAIAVIALAGSAYYYLSHGKNPGSKNSIARSEEHTSELQSH